MNRGFRLLQPVPTAATITIPQTLALLDGDFAGVVTSEAVDEQIEALKEKQVAKTATIAELAKLRKLYQQKVGFGQRRASRV